MRKRFLLFIIFLLLISNVILGIHYYASKTKFENIIESEKKIQSIGRFTRKGTFLNVRNVYFRFKKNIALELPQLEGELIPLGKENIVNFDDVNGFKIKVYNGGAFVPAEVLESLFREYVFNFENCTVKLEKVWFPEQKEGENIIMMKGELNFVIWLGFEMKARIGLNKASNTLVITAEEVKAIGTSYAKSLLATVGLNLQKLIPLPEGKGVEIIENQIIVHPFVVFPPPKLEGTFTEVSVKKRKLYMQLASNEVISFPALPDPIAKNFLFLYKGEVKFGKLIMVDANLQMIDKDPTDEFDFYIEKYFSTLASGGIAQILESKAVKVVMPDYGDVYK